MRVFCLIPAYNERGNLKSLTENLISVFKKAKIPYSIFYVLQGNDGSLLEIKKLQKKYKNIRYLYFKNPLGIGNAYRIGFDNIDKTATHVFTLDADLNHNPVYFPQFLSCMKQEKADVVIGSRYMQGGQFLDKRRWKRIISLAMNQFITVLLQIPVHDISSGFRLIKKDVIKTVKPHLREKHYPSYMEFIIQSHKNKFRLFETSIVYTPRLWGKSKMNSVKTLRDYLLFLPRVITFLRLRPDEE
jgi:dolichol-phosphate mannosyltransferase